MKKSLFRLSIFAVILLLSFVFGCEKKAEETDVGEEAGENLELEKIPEIVMNTLKTKFPDAKIHKWTEEKEGEIVLYDIEFTQQDRKFEADIKQDGSIYNWEKAIAAEDLPEIAKKAVETKYPNCTMKEIMEITNVKDGEDELEGYEVVIETADEKEVEVTVALDGKILEDSGDEK